MDRHKMLERLAMTERHVAEGEILLRRRQAFIAELDRDGHDTRDAWTILATVHDAAASRRGPRPHPERAELGLDVIQGG